MDYSIRYAEIRDAEALRDLYNHYIRTSIATFDLKEKTTEERVSWIIDHDPSSRHKLIVGEEAGTGAIVGFSASSSFRPKAAYDTSVETSIYVHPEYYGHKIGFTLYSRLFELLAQEDVHRAYACLAVPNEPSLKLHKRLGFIEVGYFTESGYKLGAFRDIQWLEKRL